MAETSPTNGPVALMQQLHDEHAGALWGYCLRLTGHDRARAEDLLQETLLRAWRSSRLLDESRGSVRVQSPQSTRCRTPDSAAPRRWRISPGRAST